MSETTVTIKYGKGYEESWVVFRGSAGELRQEITDYFGIEREGVTTHTLDDIVQMATQQAHGKRTVIRTLGGTITGTEKTDEAQQPSGSDPWKGVEQAASQPTEPEGPNPLFAEIESVSDVDALKRLWAENQPAFTAEPELLVAWKARGKALTVAA